jgi:hypothetical protein
MSALLIVFSLLAYALAALLLWRERAWRAPLVLVAGSLAVLSLPFWMQLYRVVPGRGSVLDALDVSTGAAGIIVLRGLGAALVDAALRIGVDRLCCVRIVLFVRGPGYG